MYVEGDPNANCTKTVTVERVAPTFTCPSSATAIIGASNNVSLSLSDVTGCDEGGDYCKYSITGTDDISVSGTGYASGVVASFTDANVTTDGAEKSYTVRLENSVGYVEHDCSVEFEEPPTINGTICLNAQTAQAQISSSNLGEGSYTLLHNCASTAGWWYTCTGTVKIGSTTLNCTSAEVSTWTDASIGTSPPASGSTITVSESSVLNGIGCSVSGISPVDNCSTTGFTSAD